MTFRTDHVRTSAITGNKHLEDNEQVYLSLSLSFLLYTEDIVEHWVDSVPSSMPRVEASFLLLDILDKTSSRATARDRRNTKRIDIHHRSRVEEEDDVDEHFRTVSRRSLWLHSIVDRSWCWLRRWYRQRIVCSVRLIHRSCLSSRLDWESLHEWRCEDTKDREYEYELRECEKTDENRCTTNRSTKNNNSEDELEILPDRRHIHSTEEESLRSHLTKAKGLEETERRSSHRLIHDHWLT